jgi:hypothetical protein
VIERAKGEVVGPKSEIPAAGARFRQTTHGGAHIWMEGAYCGWGKVNLRWWECVIERRVRGEAVGPESKNRAAGARFR